MNFFNKIRLNNFRNFEDFQINFGKKCNIFIGPNGSGKTNLLEAISLFEKGKGFRKDPLREMVNNNNQKKMFLINATFNTSKNILDLSLFSELKENKFKKKFID